jgi:hypothetical protein
MPPQWKATLETRALRWLFPIGAVAGYSEAAGGRRREQDGAGGAVGLRAESPSERDTPPRPCSVACWCYVCDNQLMETQQILPNPDVHSAFVMLHRDPKERLDDVWNVYCPGCHYGVLFACNDLASAAGLAVAHRRQWGVEAQWRESRELEHWQESEPRL